MASDEKKLLTSKREDDGRKLITEPKQPKKNLINGVSRKSDKE